MRARMATLVVPVEKQLRRLGRHLVWMCSTDLLEAALQLVPEIVLGLGALSHRVKSAVLRLQLDDHHVRGDALAPHLDPFQTEATRRWRRRPLSCSPFASSTGWPMPLISLPAPGGPRARPHGCCTGLATVPPQSPASTTVLNCSMRLGESAAWVITSSPVRRTRPARTRPDPSSR